jgi:hypothetical protein
MSILTGRPIADAIDSAPKEDIVVKTDNILQNDEKTKQPDKALKKDSPLIEGGIKKNSQSS